MVTEEAIQRKIAKAVSEGATLDELESRFGVTFEVIRAMRQSPGFRAMVEDYAADTREAARLRLLHGAKKAVDELIRFVGHPNVSERDELAAIGLILSLTLKPEETKGKSVKGVSRQTVEDIRNEIIKKRV